MSSGMSTLVLSLKLYSMISYGISYNLSSALLKGYDYYHDNDNLKIWGYTKEKWSNDLLHLYADAGFTICHFKDSRVDSMLEDMLFAGIECPQPTNILVISKSFPDSTKYVINSLMTRGINILVAHPGHGTMSQVLSQPPKFEWCYQCLFYGGEPISPSGSSLAAHNTVEAKQRLTIAPSPKRTSKSLSQSCSESDDSGRHEKHARRSKTRDRRRRRSLSPSSSESDGSRLETDSEESSFTCLFWEVNDSSIPDDLASDLGSVCQLIKSALAKEGYCGEMFISAYIEDGSKLLSAATALSETALFETPLEVPGGKDSQVRRMVHDVLIWAADNPVNDGGDLIVVSDHVGQGTKLSEILCILKAREYSVRTLTTEWVSRILSDRREPISQSESGSGSLSEGTLKKLPLKIYVTSSNPKSTIEDNDSDEESHHKFLERSYEKGKAEHTRGCKSRERQRDRRRRRSMSPTSSESDERREK